MRLLVAMMLLMVSAVIAAEDKMTLKALSALEKQSEPLPLSLEFSQKKQLSRLPRPLVSAGQLDIRKDEIVWTTEQPQQQQLTINRQGIFEQGNEDSVSGSDTIA